MQRDIFGQRYDRWALLKGLCSAVVFWIICGVLAWAVASWVG